VQQSEQFLNRFIKKVILTAVYTYGPVWPSDLTKLKAPNIIPLLIIMMELEALEL
jgi:hypothetical protein